MQITLRRLFAVVTLTGIFYWLGIALYAFVETAPNFRTGFLEGYLCRGLFGLDPPTADEWRRAKVAHSGAVTGGALIGFVMMLATLFGIVIVICEVAYWGRLRSPSADPTAEDDVAAGAEGGGEEEAS